jgi:hypothetical protein
METEVLLVLLRVVSPIMLVAADPMLYDEMSRLGFDEAQAYLNTVKVIFAGRQSSGQNGGDDPARRPTLSYLYAEEEGS